MKECNLTAEIVRWLLVGAGVTLLFHFNSQNFLWANCFALISFVAGILALGGLAGSVQDNLPKIGSNVRIWLRLQLFSFIMAVLLAII